MVFLPACPEDFWCKDARMCQPQSYTAMGCMLAVRLSSSRSGCRCHKKIVIFEIYFSICVLPDKLTVVFVNLHIWRIACVVVINLYNAHYNLTIACILDNLDSIPVIHVGATAAAWFCGNLFLTVRADYFFALSYPG